MRNKILGVYPQSKFQSSGVKVIYVADFSERTQKVRGVEISEIHLRTPDDLGDMDCLKINNDRPIILDFNVFNDNQFKDEDNNDTEHCECCFFPYGNNETTWVAFIEIKDCKSKNISDFKDKAKEQIISTVSLFRQKGIMNRQKRVYGIISFPRRNKTSFNQMIFEDYTEYKRLFQSERIHFIAANEVNVIDNYNVATTN